MSDVVVTWLYVQRQKHRPTSLHRYLRETYGGANASKQRFAVMECTRVSISISVVLVFAIMEWKSVGIEVHWWGVDLGSRRAINS